MTTTAPLYPQAWNEWRIALSGPATSDPGSQILNLDTLSRVTAWLEHNVHDVGEVRLLEATTAPTVRRREDLDEIPMLPPGDYHEAIAFWWYDGTQRAIVWPATDRAMLLSVQEPDRVEPAPEGLLDRAAGTLDRARKKTQTFALTLGIAALLIAGAVAVGSRAMSRRPRYQEIEQ